MSNPISVGGVVLLVLASIFWLIHTLYLLDSIGREVHGDAVVGHAFGWLIAIVFGALTWVCLGGVLKTIADARVLPDWTRVSFVVLFLCIGAAGAAAYYLLQDPKKVWPAAIPIAIPPLIIVFAIGLFSSARGFFISPSTGAVFGGLVVLLVLAPWSNLAQTLQAHASKRIESAQAQLEWESQERERKRAEYLPQIATMDESKRLMDWYPLIDPENGVREEAMLALRKIERRQSDIEDMLAWGIPMAMYLIPELDLQPTPQLCTVARAFLLKEAGNYRVGDPKDARTWANGSFEKSTPAIRWLQSHGCDCGEGIAAFETSIRGYLDSRDRAEALARIAELRGKSAEPR